MHNRFIVGSLRRFLGLGLLLTLCACAMFKDASTPPTKPRNNAGKISITEYVSAIAIANTVLENGGSLADIAAYTKKIEAYSTPKKAKPASLTIALIEYKNSAGKNRKTFAPLNEANSFAALSEALSQLDSATYTLKEIRLLKTTIAPSAPFKTKGKEEATIRQALAERAQSILSTSSSLPAIDEARMHIKLLTYFTASQRRDAAYICADNAKRLLPAVNQQADAAATAQLEKDLSAAESTLRQKMPY